MAGPTFSASAYTYTASGTTVVTSIAASANDTIIAIVVNTTNAAGGAVAPTSVIDASQGALIGLGTWSTAAFNFGGQIFVLTSATAITHTITATFPSTCSPYLILLTYSNSLGSFVDQSYGTFLTSTTTTITGSVTNVQSNDTVISFVQTYGGVAASSESGTIRFGGSGLGVSVQAQDQTQAGSGVISPFFSYATATDGLFLVVSLQNTSASTQLMGQICL